MSDPFSGYDAWKTASPYDDDPDVLEQCQAAKDILRNVVDDFDNLTPAYVRSELHRVQEIVSDVSDWIEENI